MKNIEDVLPTFASVLAKADPNMMIMFGSFAILAWITSLVIKKLK